MKEEEYNLAWKNSIEQAMQLLDKTGWDKTNNSRGYDVEYNGKLYPPKVVYREAINFFEKDFPNERVPSLSGGIPTNNFLEKIGFAITSKFNIVDIGDKPIFKFSMGIFFKTTKYRNLNIVERLNKLNLICMHINTGKDAGTIYANELHIGDYIYITFGKDKLGSICKITSDLIDLPEDLKKDINDPGYKARRIEKLSDPIINNTVRLANDKRFWLPSGNSTLYQITNIWEANKILFNKYYNVNIKSGKEIYIEELLEDANNTMRINYAPLNQIIYGPPGTGKTYNTINKALELLGEDLQSKNRGETKDLFEEYVKGGQIVFSTFHQSMSYEDFIEGLKPLLVQDSDNFDVGYEIRSGVFKTLCKRAINEYYKQNTENTTSIYQQLNNFDDGWNTLVEDVEKSLDTNSYFTLKTLTGKEMEIISISNLGNLNLRPKVIDGLDYVVSYPRTQKLFEAYPDLSVIKNIDKEFRSIIGGSNSTAYWCVLNYIHNKIKTTPINIVAEQPTFNENLIKFDNKAVKIAIDENVKPYVLIIDEINRGNVSQIFGELITLLEEDKRLGNDEALEVILPYSKEKFGVPPNLYIIGTMNTADRSVEALDTALRRRFSFQELMPQPQLLKDIIFEGFTLEEVLQTINNRIEILLDSDHTIGHSYFIKIDSNDTNALNAAFKNCIIPLLQEYFYHDYEKIALVLGEGFVTVKETKNVTFATFSKTALEKPDVTRRFEITIPDVKGIEYAVALLLNKAEGTQDEQE